jgi:DNA mismatch endonuclease (patch repair protein)
VSRRRRWYSRDGSGSKAKERRWTVRVRSEGTGPERRVRSAAEELGLAFRMNVKELPGSPDLVFDSLGVACFVHGCFWHSHAGCERQRIPFPAELGKRAYWHGKIIGNVLRDERVARELERLGWEVVVLWDCQTRDRVALGAALHALRRSVTVRLG